MGGRQEQGMRTVKEQEILTLAPNANAVSNARKISSGNGFVVRKKSADDTFYMGECTGSGKSNYITSADFQDGVPVCRCSCPSRQFPCKHGLALLYEIVAGKSFDICEIPEDILKRSWRRKRKPRRARPARTRLAALREMRRKRRRLRALRRRGQRNLKSSWRGLHCWRSWCRTS